jgi:O-antigen ligase
MAVDSTLRRARPKTLGPSSRGLLLAISLGAAAVVVGALAVERPLWAVGLVVTAAACVVIAIDVRTLPPFLLVSVFAEAVSVGGLNVGRLMGPLALAVVIYYILSGGRVDLRAYPLLTVSVALGMWVLFSFYWAPSSHYVYTWIFRWALSFAFALAFAILIREEKHVRWVLVAFVAAASVFGVVGLLTYVSSGGIERGTGLTGDPNQFAAYEALAVPAALVLARTARRTNWTPLLYAVIGLIGLAILASYSRGGLIALGVIVIGTIVVPWQVFFRTRRQKATYVLVIAAVGWVLAVLGSAAYADRLATIFSGQGRGAGRTDFWSAAWAGYKEHPLLGLGAGGFEARSLDLLHTTPGVEIQASYVAADRPLHNAYLESLVDLGPLGLALFLSVVVLTFAYLVRAALRARRAGADRLWQMGICFAVALVGLAVAIIFLSIQFGHMLWIFVGLALALDSISKRRVESAPVREQRASRPAETAPRG